MAEHINLSLSVRQLNCSRRSSVQLGKPKGGFENNLIDTTIP